MNFWWIRVESAEFVQYCWMLLPCHTVLSFFFDLLKAMLLFFSTVEFTALEKSKYVWFLCWYVGFGVFRFWSVSFLKLLRFFYFFVFFPDVVMCMFCSEFILIWRSRQVGIKFGVVKTIYITSLAKKHWILFCIDSRMVYAGWCWKKCFLCCCMYISRTLKLAIEDIIFV